LRVGESRQETSGNGRRIYIRWKPEGDDRWQGRRIQLAAQAGVGFESQARDTATDIESEVGWKAEPEDGSRRESKAGLKRKLEGATAARAEGQPEGRAEGCDGRRKPEDRPEAKLEDNADEELEVGSKARHKDFRSRRKPEAGSESGAGGPISGGCWRSVTGTANDWLPTQVGG